MSIRIHPQDISAELQALAEQLRKLPETLRMRVEIRISSGNSHQVQTLDELRSVWAILVDGEADSSTGRHKTQWVRGAIGSTDVVAHYAPGLLGKVKRMRVVERDVETHIDVSRLQGPLQ